MAISTALLLILSGIGRISAGVFPCDPGGMPVEPSFSQKVHNLSAIVTVFSLIAAGFLCFLAGPNLLRPRWIRWYSLLSAGAGLLFLVMMRAAIPDGGIGLFQRASLGVLNVWILVLSVMVWRLRTIPSARAEFIQA